MAGFDFPSNNPLNAGGQALSAWLVWFQRVHNIVIASQQSGTTAERPNSGLYVGRRFYDTTLNKPIYFSALPDVWRDAQGTIV